MADVSLPVPTPGDREGRDRAQLLLVGALTLAVVFLSLSVLLNSVIYTENLATRQTSTEVEEATTYRFAVVDGFGGAIDHANRGDAASFADRREDYRNVTDAVAPILANYSATDGLMTDVDRRSAHAGTRIVDANESTGWVRQDGASDWTVATDSRIRRFTLEVNVSTVDTSNDARIVLDDGTPRTLTIEDDGSGPQLHVENGGADPTCALDDGHIDIGAAQVDGRHCPALSDVTPTDPVTVSIESGDGIEGTYSLVVDRHEAGFRTAVDGENFPDQCSPPPTPTYNTSDAGEPYTTPAIYAVTADIAVRTQDIHYERTVRAAPGEAGDPPVEPTFTQFDAYNTSSTSLTVDWNATDPTGDLDRVEISLYNVTAGATEVAPSNESAFGSKTYTGLTNSSTYAINATAVDLASNRRNVSSVQSPDGGGGCPP